MPQKRTTETTTAKTGRSKSEQKSKAGSSRKKPAAVAKPRTKAKTSARTKNASSPTKRTRSSAKVSSPRQVQSKVSHEQIAKRAFEIWLAKGCPADRDDQNWWEAEADLRSGKSG